MSRKSNLVTLRSHRKNFNLSNFNKNFYLLGLNYVKAFKQMLLKKNVLLCNETLNYFNNKVFLKGDLFFRSNKLKSYKKKKLINKSFIDNFYLFNKDKKILLTAGKMNKKMRINFFISNIKVLNKKLNKELLLFLFRKTKIYASQIFSRRFGLFMDFVKLTTLFFYNKVDLKSYLYFITETFKYLRKKSHSRFFLFLKNLFSLLISETSQFYKRNSTYIKGIKLLISGRLKGKPMASKLIIQKGLVPTQTLSANVDFTKAYTFTQRFGVFGFKMWVYRS